MVATATGVVVCQLHFTGLSTLLVSCDSAILLLLYCASSLLCFFFIVLLLLCVSQQKPRSCWISLSSSSFCCYCSRLHYTHAPSFFFSVSFFILILVLAAVCTKSPLRFLLAVRTKSPLRTHEEPAPYARRARSRSKIHKRAEESLSKPLSI